MLPLRPCVVIAGLYSRGVVTIGFSPREVVTAGVCSCGSHDIQDGDFLEREKQCQTDQNMELI